MRCEICNRPTDARYAVKGALLCCCNGEQQAAGTTPKRDAQQERWARWDEKEARDKAHEAYLAKRDTVTYRLHQFGSGWGGGHFEAILIIDGADVGIIESCSLCDESSVKIHASTFCQAVAAGAQWHREDWYGEKMFVKLGPASGEYEADGSRFKYE